MNNQTIHVDGLKLGSFIASRVNDDLNWGEGAIQPQAVFSAPRDREALIKAVLSCLEPVSEKEQAYSSCTDGRCPVRLLNDENVPVREQMVGADIVSAFYVAEALGGRFYKRPEAPVAERVRDVAEFLRQSGIIPSTHLGCGAATSFNTITLNAVRFTAKPDFVKRIQAILPDGVYDNALHEAILTSNDERVDRQVYKDLTADTFVEAVEAVSGKRAIAELKDDGRGVHGHVEEAIIRVRIPGYALNVAKLAEMTNGREVFAVNDGRMEKLARLFGRGNDNDYKVACMALEDFASTGHGTLAKDLPTYIVTSA